MIILHGDIKEVEVFGRVGDLTSKDGSLNSSTVGSDLIRIDRLVQLTAFKEIRDQGLNFGDTNRTADQDDVVDLLAGNLSILQDFLKGIKKSFEMRRIDVLKTSPTQTG